MRLIDRSQNEKILRYLSDDEVAAIRRFCGRTGIPKASDEATVLAVLNEMRDGRGVAAWLECDCHPKNQGAGPTPKLSVQCRVSGTIFFRRLPNHGDHLCELRTFRAKPDTDDENGETTPSHHPNEPILDPLEFLEPERTERTKRPVEETENDAGPRESGKRLPRLGRVLNTILSESGFDVLSTARGPKPWEKIVDFADSEAMSESLCLGQILSTKPWERVADIMAKVDRLPWPAGKRRSALLLFIADEIKEGKAYTNYGFGRVEIAPVKKIRISGRDQKFSKPPYWVLVVIDRDATGQARYREAFAQHAYTKKCPIPLDSNAERHTLDVLLGKLGWTGVPAEASIEIRKPLFDFILSRGERQKIACRPDFEIDIRKKTDDASSPVRVRAVIETMGSQNEAYRSAKAGMHVLMEMRGPVVKHDVGDGLDQVSADQLFRKRLYGVAMRALGK